MVMVIVDGEYSDDGKQDNQQDDCVGFDKMRDKEFRDMAKSKALSLMSENK